MHVLTNPLLNTWEGPAANLFLGCYFLCMFLFSVLWTLTALLSPVLFPQFKEWTTFCLHPSYLCCCLEILSRQHVGATPGLISFVISLRDPCVSLPDVQCLEKCCVMHFVWVVCVCVCFRSESESGSCPSWPEAEVYQWEMRHRLRYHSRFCSPFAYMVLISLKNKISRVNYFPVG